MRIDILTTFPEMFPPVLEASILARAQAKGVVRIGVHDLRDWSKDKHRKVDDKPYGGGAGMVLSAEPILRAVDSLAKEKRVKDKKQKIVILSAKGKQFNQKTAYSWAKKYRRIIFVSGRYEGIDERVKIALRAEEISIGPFVLTDGDAAAMVIISAIARLIPGVIKLESLAEESHGNLLLKKEAKAAAGKGLEYPHYTRPEVLQYRGKKYRVPKILLSGDHKKIKAWREKH